MNEALPENDPDRTLIVFRVADREYGLPVHKVAEVLRMVAVTELPDAPEWLSGVIDLRGQTLPVVDLRARLGLARKPPDVDTMIVVVADEDRSAGLVVDEATEAITVPVDAIANPDDLAGDKHPLSGILTTDERLILVLDPARLLGSLDNIQIPDDIAVRA